MFLSVRPSFCSSLLWSIFGVLGRPLNVVQSAATKPHKRASNVPNHVRNAQENVLPADLILIGQRIAMRARSELRSKLIIRSRSTHGNRYSRNAHLVANARAGITTIRVCHAATSAPSAPPHPVVITDEHTSRVTTAMFSFRSSIACVHGPAVLDRILAHLLQVVRQPLTLDAFVHGMPQPWEP